MRDRLDIIHFNMIQRCTNPNSTYFPRYGGRGITVCHEWRTRNNFKEWALSHGYRNDLTIDRIDNDKGYSPDNCRWVTPSQNCCNRSTTHFVTAFGKRQSLMEWSRELNISYNTLKKRVTDHHEDGEYLLRPSRRKAVI
jgi:hypothetical protein|nr:MAG TPA: homing endonuclease [Caudoviricetes sp.]